MSCSISVKHVLRSMPGGAETRLALCSNGNHYVVKCANNRQGPNTLANEMLGAELLKALSLPTVPWRFAKYRPRYFPSAVCPFHHLSCPLHFASEFITPSNGGRLYNFLPSAFVHRVVNRTDFIGALVFDVWAGSADARQAVFVEDRESGTFNAVFIDNGHLFGGPYWKFGSRPGTALCLDLAIYPDLSSEAIEAWIARIETTIPLILPSLVKSVRSEWYKGDIASLTDTLLRRAEWLRGLVWRETRTLEMRCTSFRGSHGSSPRTNILPPGIQRHGLAARHDLV